jgi:hypothetical protein
MSCDRYGWLIGVCTGRLISIRWRIQVYGLSKYIQMAVDAIGLTWLSEGKPNFAVLRAWRVPRTDVFETWHVQGRSVIMIANNFRVSVAVCQ